MKKRINILLTLVFSVILLSHIACNTSDNPNCSSGKGMWDDREIRVINNSNQEILVSYSTGYPDTNSMNIKSHFYYSATESVESKGNGKIISQCDWESYFNEAGGILMFFVFLDDLEEGESDFFFKPEIFKNHTLLKRYDLTIEDIEQMDWELVYP